MLIFITNNVLTCWKLTENFGGRNSDIYSLIEYSWFLNGVMEIFQLELSFFTVLFQPLFKITAST